MRVPLYFKVDSEQKRKFYIGSEAQRASAREGEAVFASTLSGKEPAVAVYDTDGMWGKFEQRIWTVANELGIKFFWFDGKNLRSK